MEILKIIIWPLITLLGWMFTIFILRNKIKSASFDKSKGKADLKMMEKSEKFNDELGDTSMTVEILNKSQEEINKLDNQGILENIEIKEFEIDQKYFRFSKYLERSLIPDSLEEKRRIRFRVGLQENIPKIFDINIYAYFVITKIIRHENNVGWGSNWPQLSINKNFIPVLEDYWTISHDIDTDEYISPLKSELKNENIINLAVAVYAIGYLEDGKRVLGMHKYNWDKETCKYGTARLKEINEKELSYEAFDEIVTQIPEKGIWPNLK